MNFSKCDKSGALEGFAVVRQCDRKTAKNGSVYLDMLLSDLSGEIVAKLWDFKEDIQPLPAINSLVKVRGTLSQFNGNDQLSVSRIRPVAESDGVKIEDYVKSADYDADFMFLQLMSVAEDFRDSDLRSLVTTMLENNRERLLTFPAAYKLHHAMRGGLLYHTLSIVRLAKPIAQVYPFIDSDLLLSGVILHDLAKTVEFNVNDTGLADSYTTDGELIGHIVRGAMFVEETGKQLGIPDETRRLVEHMLLSHHGVPEYGAAVYPMFPEAEILSQLDMLDARIYEMADALSNVEPLSFSTRQKMLDNRKLYNHGRKEIAPKAKLD
ncbi:MAG: HD domain-containing protein [Clostridiales bacterium]|nr:HD domain-containing protein [Clostridiales bacterium]